jgi:hypothetical protein
MRRDNTDLAATAVAAAACSAGVAIPGFRVVAGLFLVLVLPGYALSALIVPAGPGEEARISPVLSRGMWAVGLSLAVTALGGLLLNLTPVGLTRMTWALSLSAVTVLAVAASAWRRGRRSHAGGLGPAAPAAPRTLRRLRMVARYGYGLAAFAIAAAAIGLAVVSAGWQHSPGLGQLWLVPARSTAASGMATLGVRSGYQGTGTFHLILRRGAHVIGTWDFTLGAGRSWQRTVSAPAGQRLTAQLTAVGRHAAAQNVAVTSS